MVNSFDPIAYRAAYKASIARGLKKEKRDKYLARIRRKKNRLFKRFTV